MTKEFVRRKYFLNILNSLKGNIPIQVISGPRQVGKTTLALNIKDKWDGPTLYESADSLNIPSRMWIEEVWNKARSLSTSERDVLLILDEVQKITGWSEIVKKLVDEDKIRKIRLKILLLGSSALLVQRGLRESLAGRFELHRLPHWSYSECNECFNMTLDDYLIFGGYPAAIPLKNDYVRWGRYIRDSIIETVIGKDVLLMSPVQKPSLLRQVFGLACASPAQILSFQKMIGQLSDVGNTTTISHHLNLLSSAYLLSTIPRWSASKIRQRGSIPKLILRDNSLINSMIYPSGGEDLYNPIWRGRLIENAVGAVLITLSEESGGELFYWRERNEEVDYIFKIGKKIFAIEVKSDNPSKVKSLYHFLSDNENSKGIIIGATQSFKNITTISLEEFFKNPEIIFSSR